MEGGTDEAKALIVTFSKARAFLNNAAPDRLDER